MEIQHTYRSALLLVVVWCVPGLAQIPCPSSLGRTSAAFRSNGDIGVIPVFAPDSCSWSASTTASWIRLNVPSGTGFGEVRYSVIVNVSAAPRSAAITIGQSSFLVTQEGANLTVGLRNTFTKFDSLGGTDTVTVQLQTQGVPWTAVSQVPWITVLNGAFGAGNGYVNFGVAVNTGALPRHGDLIIAGVHLTITQSGTDPGMRFVPVTPCRVVDTRTGTVMAAGSTRSFSIGQGPCGTMPNATAYSLNVTAVPRGPLGFLTLWPTDQPRPYVSTLNAFDGRIKSNAALVPSGTGGAVSVFATDSTDVILDINGYFVPASTANTLSTMAFVSYNNCRLVDTRQTSSFNAGETRTFQFGPTNCSYIPPSAGAVSLNITAIPKAGPLSYLTAWPADSQRPVVSTLNSPTGTIVANAAIVPVSPNGSISVYVTDAADVIIDMNGFFDRTNDSLFAYHFYPLTPCRLADTRNSNGTLAGPEMRAGETREFAVPAGPCGVPSISGPIFYSLNATVVPDTALSFLSLFPTTFFQPVVSTLNAYDGSVTSNLAIVRGSEIGSIDAYVPDRTHLVLDISGYFAEP